MRTPESRSRSFSGNVSLSKNGKRRVERGLAMSSPILNPRRIPCFTQAGTTQRSPSFSAARIEPSFSPALSSSKSRPRDPRAGSVFGSAAAASIARARYRVAFFHEGSGPLPRRDFLRQELQPARSFSIRLRCRRARARAGAATCLRTSPWAQRALGGSGARLPEVHLHERQVLPLELPRILPATLERRADERAHVSRDLVRRHGDQSPSPEGDQRQRGRVVAGEDDEVLGEGVMSRAILPKLGDASFKPTTRGISAMRRIVSTSMSVPVRLGTL